MKRKLNLLVTVLLVSASPFSGLTMQGVNIEKGVSLELARYRAAHVGNVRYNLLFDVPASKAEPVAFDAELLFAWDGDEDLQIDFQGDMIQLGNTIVVNGREVPTRFQEEHVIVSVKWLEQGENKIRIRGMSGEKALNRHEDYMYTLFVPDHARSAFPCFDQPDLKAQFELRLELPDGWTAISNAPLKGDVHDSSGRLYFALTQNPIPTYLFSFTAGRFQTQTAVRDGREFTALYRETDLQKVAQLPIVFDHVALSLRWMENYTGIAYPFEKYDFVVLPGYQFGGMEHPGCIQYTDWEIFLGPNPTPDEEMTRLNLIAHETSHMWFGDLVTMRWFDDVWTKEVYANFMADKISREQFPDVNHDLAFIKAHYPVAMSTDRTQGTHPIQQPLDNLNQAGLLYGNIIYHKAPIVMRKLEQEKGSDALQQGLRSYLNRYAYSNATWDDLIAELDKFAPEHSAQSFSDVWVKQKGMPVYKCELNADGNLEIVQQDPWGRGLLWKQAFDVAFDPDGACCELNNMGGHATVNVPAGTIPIINHNGEGYGRFAIDERQSAHLLDTWHGYETLERYSAMLTLYENYHMGNVDAESLFNSLFKGLLLEQNDLIASTLCSFLGTIVTRLDGEGRENAEQQLFDVAGNHTLQSVRQNLLRQLSLKATSQRVVDALYTIWEHQGAPSFNNRDYMRMAYHLALMRTGEWQAILAMQRNRLTTDDERREFDFVSRACNPDKAIQQQLFNDLLKVENRRVEPWARTMLALLNDPVREPYSNRYLEPGLDALEEIQRTGDIFFPGYWLSSLLDGHQSDEARQIVANWIETHSTLNPALMNKLKENAYWLITFPGKSL